MEHKLPGPLQVVHASPAGRIVVTDSLTYCDERIGPLDVVIGGSFMGAYPAVLALRRGARGIIGNAAGIGKDQAGIAGLPLADRWGVPCVAVSECSARLADGWDVYNSGRIAHLNRAAAALGVRVGQACAEAARLMLAAPPGEPGRAAELVDTEGRISAMASVGLAKPDNAGEVICAGSHTALVTWRYVTAYTFPVAGVICSDAGIGKDRSGIAALEPLAEAGVAAAAVSHQSARLGEGRSTYADGIIAHVNRVVEQAGVLVGMTAHRAALAMLRADAARRGGSVG